VALSSKSTFADRPKRHGRYKPHPLLGGRRTDIAQIGGQVALWP
jgi:hypothetical protein